jgi:hypothetical protein
MAQGLFVAVTVLGGPTGADAARIVKDALLAVNLPNISFDVLYVQDSVTAEILDR